MEFLLFPKERDDPRQIDDPLVLFTWNRKIRFNMGMLYKINFNCKKKKKSFLIKIWLIVKNVWPFWLVYTV